jgi:hypothetical protein
MNFRVPPGGSDATMPGIPAFAGITALRRLCCIIGIGFALIITQSVASAESAVEALKTFGLIGTWSPNCAKPTDPMGYRLTYSAPIFVPPSEILNAWDDNQKKQIEVSKEQIVSAIRVTAKSLKLTIRTKKDETWDAIILQIDNDKIVMTDVYQADGRKIKIKDGHYYIGAGMPSGVESDTLEKCLN